MPRKATLKLKEQIPTEKEEQIKLFVWLRKNNIYSFSIPNGGSRNYYEAVSLNRQGLTKGIPDICVPMARKGKHSLYIELKRKTGSRVSPEQKNALEALNSLGNMAVVCYGFEDAKKVITDYLSDVPRGT